MARKRKSRSDDGGVSLDSLMDALTNVVAVLILVLILVQADVSQKVVQFLDDLAPATQEEVALSHQKAEKLEKEKLKLQNLISEEAPKPEELEAKKRQLAQLETDVKENNDILADLMELRKLEKKTRTQRDSENKISTTIQNQIAKLKALLDSNPVKTIPPTVVNIPTSKSIPKNAEIYHVLILNNRVHFIDPYTPVKLFNAEFKTNKRHWLIRRIKQKGKDRLVYDQTKIAQHFKNFDFKNSRGQTVQLVTNPFSTRMNIVIKTNPKNGGTSLEDLANKNCLFRKILKKLSSNIRAVIMFNVHPNSFNSYLQTRRITDKTKIAAGWQISGRTHHVTRLNEIEVNRLKTPPPPVHDPNKPPAPPRPPSLPPKLD